MLSLVDWEYRVFIMSYRVGNDGWFLVGEEIRV